MEVDQAIKNRQRLIVGGSVFFVFLLVVLWLVFRGGGEVRIIAVPGTATLYEVTQDGEREKIGVGEAVISEKGDHTVVAEVSGGEAFISFSLNDNSKTELTLTVEPPRNSIKLGGYFADDIVVSDNAKKLRFRHAGTYEMLQTSAERGSGFTDLGVDAVFAIHWIDYSRAVVVDRFGEVFTYNKGELSSTGIKSEFPKDFSVATNQLGQYAIIHNEQLLVVRNFGDTPEKIASGIQEDALIVLSEKGQVLYIEKRDEGDIDDTVDEVFIGERPETTPAQLKLFDINSGEELYGAATPDGLNGAQNLPLYGEWSPGGDKVLIATPLQYVVYDNETKAVVPTVNFSLGFPKDLDWLDNNRAVLTTDAGLWAYDTSSRQGLKLADANIDQANSTTVIGSLVFYSEALANQFRGGTINRLTFN